MHSTTDPEPPHLPEPAAPDAPSEATGQRALARLLRTLLRVRGVEEAEGVITRGVAEFAGASHAALLVREGGHYVCVRCEGAGGPEIGTQIPGAAIGRWLEGVEYTPATVDGGAQELRRIGAAVAIPLPPGDAGRHLLLLGARPGGSVYTSEDLLALGQVAQDCTATLRSVELLERLQSQVFVDFLTECYNRRGFEERLRVETVRARRYRRPLTLLMVDVDYFKRINDTQGHPVGDHALRALGSLLRHAFRTTDVVCRYGGDEFAVLFPETPKEEVLRLAERLRTKIHDIFPDEVLPSAITASVGVASYPQDASDADELVRTADRALYQAKLSGRDRVVAA